MEMYYYVGAFIHTGKKYIINTGKKKRQKRSLLSKDAPSSALNSKLPQLHICNLDSFKLGIPNPQGCHSNITCCSSGQLHDFSCTDDIYRKEEHFSDVISPNYTNVSTNNVHVSSLPNAYQNKCVSNPLSGKIIVPGWLWWMQFLVLKKTLKKTTFISFTNNYDMV